jgi:hypothetical protein
MKPYEKGTIKERGEKAGIYNFVSKKQIESAKRRLPDIHSAGITVQVGFIRLYYSPSMQLKK